MLPTIHQIIADLSEMHDSEDKIDYVIELGATLPILPEKFQTPENRVKGCQSGVWIVVNLASKNGRIFLSGTSDAATPKGLLALVFSVYNELTLDQMKLVDFDAVLRHLEIKTFVSPQRVNGMVAMKNRVLELAKEL